MGVSYHCPGQINTGVNRWPFIVFPRGNFDLSPRYLFCPFAGIPSMIFEWVWAVCPILLSKKKNLAKRTDRDTVPLKPHFWRLFLCSLAFKIFSAQVSVLSYVTIFYLQTSSWRSAAWREGRFDEREPHSTSFSWRHWREHLLGRITLIWCYASSWLLTPVCLNHGSRSVCHRVCRPL